MKFPKTQNRYCPTCKKHTSHKVAQGKKRQRGSARPQSKGATARVRARGRRRGFGNFGKYSKPALKPVKQTKKTDIRYTCTVCKKSHAQPFGKRAKKVEFE